jgi:Mrp family chromosome partitioning ATPase
MAGLIAHLRSNCDLVIIDAPPLFAARELRAVAALCDAVLAVARDGDAASSALAPLGLPRAGLVIAR